MVFVDVAQRIGRGAIGSANLAAGIVTAEKIATHAVGTGQQGTITLARSFGTVENLSIGSWMGAFGSLNTLASRRVRTRMLYLTGSMGAGTVPASRVNVGTLPSPRLGTFGAGKTTYGTFGVGRIPQLQSLTGTLPSPHLGSFGAGKTTYGTLGAARHQLVQNIPGTLQVNHKAAGTWVSGFKSQAPASGIVFRGLSAGGVDAELLDVTVQAGSRWLIQSNVQGTAQVKPLAILISSALAGEFTQGGFSSPVGSFGRIAGTFGAAKTTYGTLGVGRIPQLQNLTGTLQSLHLGTFGGGKLTYGTVAPSPRLGTFGAGKTTYGTFAGARMGQYVGTHFGGSNLNVSAGSLEKYIVWPSAFPNATYKPLVTIEARPGLIDGIWATVQRRAPGSMRIAMWKQSTSFQTPPAGTVHAWAFQ